MTDPTAPRPSEEETRPTASSLLIADFICAINWTEKTLDLPRAYAVVEHFKDAEVASLRAQLQKGCSCVCHTFPRHDRLQDALEALKWHQDELKKVLAQLQQREETLALVSEELEANRACNLFTWKDRACKAEAHLAQLRTRIEGLPQYCRDQDQPRYLNREAVLAVLDAPKEP